MLWRSWRREFWSTWLSGSLKTTSRAPFFVLWGPQELVKLVLGDQLPRLWDENSTGLLSEGSVISLIFEATGNYFFLFWLHFVLLFVAECIDYYDCLTNADKFCLSQTLVVSNWFFLAFDGVIQERILVTGMNVRCDVAFILSFCCCPEEQNFILGHFDTEVKFSRKSHGNLNGRSDFSAF